MSALADATSSLLSRVRELLASRRFWTVGAVLSFFLARYLRRMSVLQHSTLAQGKSRHEQKSAHSAPHAIAESFVCFLSEIRSSFFLSP